MSEFLRIVEPAEKDNTGPNIPASYSLASTFLVGNSTRQSSSSYPNTNPNPTGEGTVTLSAFPEHGRSGAYSYIAPVGVGVGEFWKGLSGQAKQSRI